MSNHDESPSQVSSEPSFGERSRTLVAANDTATLATISTEVAGFPFASLAPFAADEQGRPILLLSRLAQHTRNLAAEPRASLLVCEPGSGGTLAGPRVTLLGWVARLPQDESAAARALYIERHPEASRWVEFEDFAFHRMAVERAYFVAGFGSMGWVTGGDYGAAEPDPLLESAPGILAHMNADHADALVLYCKAYAGLDVDSAEMTAVDRLGFRVRARIGEEERDLRIDYLREARTSQETRVVLVEMVRDARTRFASPPH